MYDVVRLESCKNKLMSRGVIFLWIYSSQELMLTVESTVALAIFPQFHLCDRSFTLPNITDFLWAVQFPPVVSLDK